MKLQESGEMYLEAILVVSQNKGSVRSIDVSEYLGYSKPSVSRAIHLLIDSGYITMDDGGMITLTPSGTEIAEKIYERHKVISQLLMMLGVDEKTAIDDACKIEHDISDASFEAIKKHIQWEHHLEI